MTFHSRTFDSNVKVHVSEVGEDRELTIAQFMNEDVVYLLRGKEAEIGRNITDG